MLWLSLSLSVLLSLGKAAERRMVGVVGVVGVVGDQRVDSELRQVYL